MTYNPLKIKNEEVLVESIKIVWQASRKHFIIRIILTLIGAILPLIPIYLFKLFLDAFTSPTGIDTHLIKWLIIAIGIFSILSILVGNISAYNNSIQSDLVIDYMSRIMIDKSLDVDLEFYDSDTYFDQFSRAMSQGGTKPIAVLTGFTSLLQSAVTLLIAIGVLFTLHWSVIVVLIVITIPASYLKLFYSRKIIELQKEQTHQGRISGYYKSVLTGPGTAKEVRIFNYGSYLRDKFLRLTALLRKEKRDLYLKQMTWLSLAQIAQTIVVLSALGYIVYRAINGKFSVGDITMYYLIFQMGQSRFKALMGTTTSLYNQRLTLSYLFEFLNLEKKVIEPQSPVPLTNKVSQITLEDVSFTYPQTKSQVINNISFTADKGELVAIVGENGSGKTTLVKLLARLYDTTKGAIRYNGIDIKDVSVSQLRSKVTILFQQFASYALTVKENIMLSDQSVSEDPNGVIKAARLSTSDKYINELPHQFDTQMGRAFKDGQELSKGQWQKMAMARAIYRNADIMILDEPTSAIDPLSEDEIFQNIKSFAIDKIVFLITHRIYNLRRADKILVLDKGKLVEQGSHDYLMSIDGLYKTMFDKQNQE